MKNIATSFSISIALLVLQSFAWGAEPGAAAAESCDQIRAQIAAHTGIPARANTELLRKVGTNGACGFTSAEAYRAAWGDAPVPKETRRYAPRRHHRHDDDD